MKKTTMKTEEETKMLPVEEAAPLKPEPVAPKFDLDKKIDAINASRMPEEQKIALLKEIGAIKEESTEGKVPFPVYAKIRKIAQEKHAAYLAFPKAKGVRLASLEEWDEVFKSF